LQFRRQSAGVAVVAADGGRILNQETGDDEDGIAGVEWKGTS